jgi:hypothetical protein
MTLRFDPFSVARTVALAPVLAPLLAGALALPTGALAAPARHAPVHHASAPAPVPAVAWVALQTDQGRIVVELDGAHAPVSVGNFLHYVDTRHYDGMTFYRAMHLDWGKQPNGLLQGGIRDSRLLFKPIAHEPTSQTGILHKAGTLSLAARARNGDGRFLDPAGRHARARCRSGGDGPRSQARLCGLWPCGGGDGCGPQDLGPAALGHAGRG